MSALTSAQESAFNILRHLGPSTMLHPGLWRFEEGPVGIDVFTEVEKDCGYWALLVGLQGLIDLMTEKGGVGPVAAGFEWEEDGRGVVASGRLRDLGWGEREV